MEEYNIIEINVHDLDSIKYILIEEEKIKPRENVADISVSYYFTFFDENDVEIKNIHPAQFIKLKEPKKENQIVFDFLQIPIFVKTVLIYFSSINDEKNLFFYFNDQDSKKHKLFKDLKTNILTSLAIISRDNKDNFSVIDIID
jgi:hypothetical protein